MRKGPSSSLSPPGAFWLYSTSHRARGGNTMGTAHMTIGTTPPVPAWGNPQAEVSLLDVALTGHNIFPYSWSTKEQVDLPVTRGFGAGTTIPLPVLHTHLQTLWMRHAHVRPHTHVCTDEGSELAEAKRTKQTNEQTRKRTLKWKPNVVILSA